MISRYYSLFAGRPLNWLLLARLGAASIIIRRFFNRRHEGFKRQGLLAAGAALFVVTALVASIKPSGAGAIVAQTNAVGDDQISVIIETHCTACHAATPAHPAFTTPQGGMILESLDDVRANAESIILQTVESDIMPLGNETGMTDEERALLGAWLEQQ